MASAAGLLSCSNEVLAIVFSNPSLSKCDLKSLRLTSKETCSAATVEFVKLFLMKPFIFPSRGGLQFLVNICKNPILSPHIKSIGFLATIVDIRRVGGLRLLSLPNEVLTIMCADEDLTANDLAVIRLTCRELNAVATTEFAQRYIKDPFVMMTRKSLQALVDICKHPIFGPQVRKVQLLS
ncbi:uncharacterized protein M437DRAFT_54477, partial [Aureobasidium melanogenum CBS 110374]